MVHGPRSGEAASGVVRSLTVGMSSQLDGLTEPLEVVQELSTPGSSWAFAVPCALSGVTSGKGFHGNPETLRILCLNTVSQRKATRTEAISLAIVCIFINCLIKC